MAVSAVLVLGAGGFVGQHLVAALAAAGRPVIALTRQLGEVSELPGVEWVEADLANPESYAHLLAACPQVVHLASATTPGSSAGKPLLELEQNLAPTVALLEQLQAYPEHQLLYLSSGGTLYGNPLQSPVCEQSPSQPLSYYGAGKVASEAFIHACCHQYGVRATIMRPSNLYGPGQRARTGFGVIPTACARLLAGEEMVIWGDGEVVRDYLYIDDFTELTLRRLSQPMPSGCHSFNAASGVGISLNQLLDTLERVSGLRLTRSYQPSRGVDVQRIVLDTSALKEQCGWSAPTSLETGLITTWRWFAEQEGR